MRCRRLGFCAILLVIAGGAGCPDSRAEEATLDEAIRFGLRHNPALASLRASASAGAAAADEAAAARWPILIAEAGLRRGNNPVVVFGDKLTAAEFGADDFLLDHLNHPDPISHVSAAVSVQVPLYTSGRLAMSIASARSVAGSAEAQVRAAEADLAERITEAYYAVPLARAAMAVAESALADARGHESVASARFDAGAALRSDLLRAQVLRLSREQDIERRKADVELSRTRLRRLLGCGPGEAMEPVTSLPETADESEQAGELDSWLALGAAHRWEVEAARKAAEAAAAGEREARAALGPEIDGMARYERNASGLSFGEDSWLAGLSLRWNAIDRGRGPRLAAAAARREAAEQRERDLEDSVRLEVEQAYRDVAVAGRALILSHAMVAAADSARRISAERYAGGLLPITDLLDIESHLEEARLGELAARYDVITGRARLRHAAGALEVAP